MKKRMLVINFTLLIMINIMPASSYADNIIDNPALLYKVVLPDEPSLNQRITVNHKFNNINEFAARLNAVANISTIIKNQSTKISTPVTVILNNGTILQLLNENAKKFGYTWLWDNGRIVFSALNPRRELLNVQNVLPKVLPQNLSLALTVWSLDPKDRMLRNTLTKWCKVSGWQLIWNVNADFPIVSSWRIQGTFESAINEVLKASQTTNVPLLATMHDENKVLEIYSASISK